MREILLICRMVVPETTKFCESLAHLDYRTRELVAYVECKRGIDNSLWEAPSRWKFNLNCDGKVGR